jgi:protein subunit release factor B
MISPETIEKIKARMALASVFEEDLEEAFVLGSGPGGQKVNKTSSAVRLYHAPSGMTVKCSESRSREQNRWLARRELAERILERDHAALSARRQEAERIRRQKRRRSRRQRARMLDDKRRHGDKKAARAPVRDEP